MSVIAERRIGRAEEALHSLMRRHEHGDNTRCGVVAGYVINRKSAALSVARNQELAKQEHDLVLMERQGGAYTYDTVRLPLVAAAITHKDAAVAVLETPEVRNIEFDGTLIGAKAAVKLIDYANSARLNAERITNVIPVLLSGEVGLATFVITGTIRSGTPVEIAQGAIGVLAIALVGVKTKMQRACKRIGELVRPWEKEFFPEM